MGNSTYTPPPVPASDKKPKGRRVHLAPIVAEDLIKWTVDNVIQDPSYLGKERECYEVSAQFRDRKSFFEAIVRDHVPGSNMARSGVARNRVTLVDRIVMVFMNFVDRDIIRPGPMPEDRSSYDIRDELYSTQTHLAGLISQVIAIEDNYEGLT